MLKIEKWWENYIKDLRNFAKRILLGLRINVIMTLLTTFTGGTYMLVLHRNFMQMLIKLDRFFYLLSSITSASTADIKADVTYTLP